MYRVWIDYKDGTHKDQLVPDVEAAKKLKAEWGELAPWRGAGFALEGSDYANYKARILRFAGEFIRDP